MLAGVAVLVAALVMVSWLGVKADCAEIFGHESHGSSQRESARRCGWDLANL